MDLLLSIDFIEEIFFKTKENSFIFLKEKDCMFFPCLLLEQLVNFNDQN